MSYGEKYTYSTSKDMLNKKVKKLGKDIYCFMQSTPKMIKPNTKKK